MPVGPWRRQPAGVPPADPTGSVTVMHTDTDGSADDPALVLLHGGTGTGRFHWSKLVPALAEGHHLHLPDLPGHGRTPLEGDRYDREVLVDAVAGLLDDLGQPVHVAAFSMGGHAAMALAQDRPELFASLTLVGVSVRDHDGLQGWRDRFDPDALAARFPLWARQLSKLHEPLGGPDAWKEVCVRDAGGLEVEVDVDALAALACPVLLVRGDRDPAVDPAHYAELREALGERSEELVIPNGGHDVQLTRSDLVKPSLLDFLERAESDR
jgi:3-oxoadipate enol-lactonase